VGEETEGDGVKDKEEPVDISDLNQHFENFLNQPWPKDAVSDRQILWLAFKAGGEWALQEIRKNARLPEPKAALEKTP
jgi:hypothetical protein